MFTGCWWLYWWSKLQFSSVGSLRRFLFLFRCLVIFLFFCVFFYDLYYVLIFLVTFVCCFVFRLSLWRWWWRVLEFWIMFLWSPVFIGLFFVLLFPLQNLCRIFSLFNIVHGTTLCWKSLLFRCSWMRFSATHCGVVGSDHQCRWQVGCLDIYKKC